MPNPKPTYVDRLGTKFFRPLLPCEMERIREYERNHLEPPRWKRKILRQIDDLVKRPGALAVFRRHIRAAARTLLKHQQTNAEETGAALRERGPDWAAAGVVGKRKDLLAPGPPLSTSETFFLLAVFHDALREAENMEAIAPDEWERPKGKSSKKGNPRRLNYYAYADDCADATDANDLPERLRRRVEKVEAELPPAKQAEPVGADAVETATTPDRDKAEPLDVLNGSAEILEALGAETVDPEWRTVKRLAESCGGPIRYRGKGKRRPYAVRSELIAWWNGVHASAEQAERQRADMEKTQAILNAKLKSAPHHAGRAAKDLGLSVNSPDFRRRGK